VLKFIKAGADIILLGAFLLAIIIQILDTAGILNIIPEKSAPLVSLVLLALFVGWTVFERRFILEEQTEQLRKLVSEVGAIRLIEGEEEVYKSGIVLVQQNHYELVRVYAPVGFWTHSPSKHDWLNALNKAVRQGRVDEAELVFGIPPWKEQYTDLKETLKSTFQDTERVLIRYLPVSNERTVFPVIGMIIFGDKALSIGFGIYQYHQKTDTAWAITNPDIVRKGIRWFDIHVWEANHARMLRGPGQSLDAGFDLIEKNHPVVLSQTTPASQETKEAPAVSRTNRGR
jgi:hypothetical protein